MTRPKTAGVLVCLLILMGGWLGANAQVQLVTPLNNETVSTRDEIALKWNAYPGAQSYRYSLLSSQGATVPPPGSPMSVNPHLVTGTEVILRITIEETWDWYVTAYSDANGTTPLAGSQSQTRRFFTSTTVVPTPTPTPRPSMDFTGDGKEDYRDIFLFGYYWMRNRSMPNLPYFDKMDLVKNNVIDQADLVRLKEIHLVRGIVEPTPTPILPAPELLRPSDGFEFVVADYNQTPGLFLWKEVDGAFDYEVELIRPITRDQTITSYIVVQATTITWTSQAPAGYYVTPNESGLYLRWRVRARNQAGAQGEWSEQRRLKLNYSPGTNPADLREDFKIDYLDVFVFARSWQAAEGEGNWNANADLDDNRIINANDLLRFMEFYHTGRETVPSTGAPQAPQVLEPNDGVEFTRQQIESGQARIMWAPIPNFPLGVGQARYRIKFYSTSLNQSFFKEFLMSTSYIFTAQDLLDTRLANNAPVLFSVQGIGPNGEVGLESPERSFIIRTE